MSVVENIVESLKSRALVRAGLTSPRSPSSLSRARSLAAAVKASAFCSRLRKANSRAAPSPSICSLRVSRTISVSITTLML